MVHIFIDQVLGCHIFFQIIDQGFGIGKYSVHFYWDRKDNVQSTGTSTGSFTIHYSKSLKKFKTLFGVF